MRSVKLSVNVNKVATLRNSRGGRQPDLLDAVRACARAGAPGVTVHPRADERHIRRRDVAEIADELAPLRGRVELNIEGDPRPDLIDLVLEVRPDQCTLVPVVPGEITSQAGWSRRGASADGTSAGADTLLSLRETDPLSDLRGAIVGRRGALATAAVRIAAPDHPVGARGLSASPLCGSFHVGDRPTLPRAR